MPKALLFDLGSTLWDDYPTELFQWDLLRSLLKSNGIEVTSDQLMAVLPDVIASFCPSLTRGIAFRLCNGNGELSFRVMEQLADQMLAVFRDQSEFLRLNPLFTCVPELLADLSGSYRLAVVSQNFSAAETWMEWHGIRQFFEHVSLSSREGIFKPDPRLFELTCRALELEPQDCIMIGDRLDNDIWPANRLQMTTVRVLADPYRIQKPRYERDLPDHTIEDIGELSGLVGQI